MEGRRCRDVIWLVGGDQNHGCCRGEGSLISERERRERERDRQTHRDRERQRETERESSSGNRIRPLFNTAFKTRHTLNKVQTLPTAGKEKLCQEMNRRKGQPNTAAKCTHYMPETLPEASGPGQ